ncbi:MAG: fibronectin type III domain-containing protein [Bacteroidales bacterium]|nr:fibronectin type III domain-containing protein [Bacteroidales bacterium]
MKRLILLLLPLALLACSKTGHTVDGPVDLTVPTNLEIKGVTETSLIFQWKTVKNATGYNWVLTEKESGEEAGVGSTAKRNVEVKSLRKGTSYLFKVRAEAGSNHSDYSEPVEAKTSGTPGPDDVAKVCADAPVVITFDSAPVLGTSGIIKVFKADGTEVDRIDLADMDKVTVLESGIMVPKEQITNASKFHTFMDAIPGGGGRYRLVHYTPLRVNGKKLEIKLHSGVLDFDSEYYVTMDESVCGKAIGAGEKKIFTKAAPSSAKELVVAADGHGDFCTLQGALSYADKTGASIAVSPGTYEEMLYLRDKSNITITSSNRDKVKILYPNSELYCNGSGGGVSSKPSAGASVGSNGGRCLFLAENCDNLLLERITIENSFYAADHKGQAECIYFNSGSNAHKLEVDDCSLISWQDTFLCKGEVWVHNSLIAGHCDFIWGYPKVCYFENCEIRSRAAGYIVQARIKAVTDKGFVFHRCRLTAEDGVAGNSVYLARSGGNSGEYDNVVYVNCTMSSAIRTVGWLGDPAPNPSTPTATSGWREYGSKDPSGNAITGHNSYGKYLTGAEAAAYCTREDVLGW